MTLLTIVRHAKSSWGDSGLADFDRPLNNRGRDAARRVGEELKKRGFRFDLVIASPARRVRETLDRMEKGYGEQLPVEFDDQVYGASEQALFDLVRRIPERAHAPMLIGHNPGLQELLLALTSDDNGGLRARVKAKFPTAAVALIDFPVPRWDEVGVGSGSIRELILPKQLD